MLYAAWHLSIASSATGALSWGCGRVGNNMVSVRITVVADRWGVGIRSADFGMAAAKFDNLAGVAILYCGVGSNSSRQPDAANEHTQTISHTARCITVRGKSENDAAGAGQHRCG
jgi:hypothetical protein